MSLAIDSDAVLNRVAQHLRQVVVPTLDGYNAYYVGMAATIIECAALEYDSAAQIRVDENNALRSLLEEAVPFVDDAFGARLKAGLAEHGVTASVRISDLTRVNRLLRSLLIEMHREVERRLNEDWAVRLNAEILTEFRVMSERYQFDKLLSTY